MATNIIDRNGDSSPTPNYKTVRISNLNQPAEATAEGSTVPLQRDIKQQFTDKESKDKTVLFKDTNGAVGTQKTGSSKLPLSPQQWVHGWLVAECGPMKGRSFPILYGNNTVGRSNDSTICLPDDANISRSQFSIRHVQKKNTYMAAPISTAKQITYLGDGEELIFPVVLTEGETLRLSPSTSVHFIPFCDEQYQWDYKELPPAPDPAPEPEPQPEPASELLPSLPPIPTDVSNLQPKTVRINTGEIGIAASPANENGGTVRIDTAALNLANPAELHATVRLNRAISGNGATHQNQTGEHTQLFRPEAGDSKELSPEKWEQGWLVAISGPMKGMYFPVTFGINQCGRSRDCRICLPADCGISGVQFSIRYVEKRKQFFVAGIDTASQPTFLNDEELMSCYEPINRGDILRVSEQTSLRFIPLCGENFNWDYPDNV